MLERGFIAAGTIVETSASSLQDKTKSIVTPIRTLEQGNIVVAYLKNHGYVGIGRVIEKAVRVNNFKVHDKSLGLHPIKVTNIFENCNNDKSEYLVKVDWIKTVDSTQGKWKEKSGLFALQLIKASLQGQPKTIEFLEKEFDVNFKDLLLVN